MFVISLLVVMGSVIADNKTIDTALPPDALDEKTAQQSSTDRPAPPEDLTAYDKPNDVGGSIILTWTLSHDDGTGKNSVVEYFVYRSTEPDGALERVGKANAGEKRYVDASTNDGQEYYYHVTAFDGEHESLPATSEKAYSSAQWFHTGRIPMLVTTLVISMLVLVFIQKARRGEKLFIRPIAGLEAVDDAVGRATEMGKPIMYIPGIMDMDNIQTIASMIILGRVARRAAEYETPLLVPCSRSIVMSAAQETVKEAFTDAGRPDAYDVDRIRYLTDDQFGYAAGVDGMMLREQPGAIFYMGAFYAESLILAETGHSTGAIQIAGTAMPSQLPFFVTACDYTLIGEELFAASAYLSREPLLLGSLKGQDWGKAIFIIVIIIGVILVSLGVEGVISFLATGQ